MTKRHEQTFIPGTEPPADPDRVPELDALTDAWQAAKEAAAEARAAKAEAEHALLVELAARGLERYPYTDSKSGKRRYFVADKTPRPKSIPAPSEKQLEKAERLEASGEPKSERVTSKRVKRTAEHDRVADPFGSTRGLLDESRDAQAAEA